MNLLHVDVGDIIEVMGMKFQLIEISGGMAELPPRVFFAHIPDKEPE